MQAALNRRFSPYLSRISPEARFRVTDIELNRFAVE